GAGLTARPGRRWGGGAFAGRTAAARAAAPHGDGAGPAAELAVALAREAHAGVFAGEPVPHELLERAVALERGLDERIPVGESPTRVRGLCALWDGDLETAWSLLRSVDRQAQARSESWRAIVLYTRAQVELPRGR